MELEMFRGQYYGWGQEYMQEYLKEVQPSEPRQVFDDRNALYAMYVSTWNSYGEKSIHRS